MTHPSPSRPLAYLYRYLPYPSIAILSVLRKKGFKPGADLRMTESSLRSAGCHSPAAAKHSVRVLAERFMPAMISPAHAFWTQKWSCVAFPFPQLRFGRGFRSDWDRETQVTQPECSGASHAVSRARTQP